jgi:hypothetical protein
MERATRDAADGEQLAPWEVGEEGGGTAGPEELVADECAAAA